MRTKRIELEGRAGHVAIQRQRGSATIRIDSIIANPGQGQQAWMTWEIHARTVGDELYEIAQAIQRRCDGVVGTHSDVDGYFRQLQRFAD